MSTLAHKSRTDKRTGRRPPSFMTTATPYHCTPAHSLHFSSFREGGKWNCRPLRENRTQPTSSYFSPCLSTVLVTRVFRALALSDGSSLVVVVCSLLCQESIIQRNVPLSLPVNHQIKPAARRISIGSIGARKRALP